MANTNTLTSVLDRILAGALEVLRQNCVMPRLVNSTFSAVAGNQGSTLELSVPGSVTATAVTPSNVPPDISGVTPSVVTMNLDKWYNAGFFMSDKDKLDIRDGLLPAQAGACVKVLANQVNSDLLALYKAVFGWAGTSGTTPFATGLDAVAAARKVLGEQLAPLSERRGVISLAAEVNFILLSNVIQANQRGDTEGIKEGRISRILGIDWFVDQAVPTHTTGAATAGTIAIDLGAGYAAGVKVMHMDGFSVKPSEGDVFTIAGQTQTYAVASSTTLVGTDSDVTFEPALTDAVLDDAVVTFKASHVSNLVFCREAFGFANRPFSNLDLTGGPGPENIRSMQDPLSGLVLRVQNTREFMRDKLNFDILYGVKCVRPELACRIAG